MSSAQIKLAETPDFDLGGVRVSPAHRTVRADGKQYELEPKVAQVLVALASERPQVVSRDRLIERCWGGRIVGDDALNRCIVALRHLAKAFSPEPYFIETVPRVGYSLTEPVDSPSKPAPAAILVTSKRAVAGLLALALVAAALAFVVSFTWDASQRSEAAPASIAVLPFRNLSSSDPHFAEGVGEEILNQLAREPQFRVAGPDFV
ncbi:MAG: winged helix-turn-helix domain-containing protein [Sphingomicrobium sp.]